MVVNLDLTIRPKSNHIPDLLISIGLLGLAPVIGFALSLLIELRLAENVRIASSMVLFDSVFLGLIWVMTFYLAGYLIQKAVNILFILCLSFGLMLGGGMLTASIFFLASPASFLYWESGSITFLAINLLFFLP